MESWKNGHKAVISDFLRYMNSKSCDYILKGGTSLMECYGLDRMSEDIDLDSVNKEDIFNIVKSYCSEHNYTYRVAKDTDMVKRFFVNYGNNSHPLKIEISYRQREIPKSSITVIHNINVYNIENIAIMKSNAYNARDKIRDLNDITFIVNNYLDKLSPQCRILVSDALSYKGIEQFDYLTRTQEDELIDIDKLAEDFLRAWDALGLIDDSLPETTKMENIWHEYFNKPTSERQGIEWEGKKMRPALFEDIYLGKCQETGVIPDEAISDHFWNNCVKYQEYEPKFCSHSIGR